MSRHQPMRAIFWGLIVAFVITAAWGAINHYLAPSPPPLTRKEAREMGEAFRALNRAWCQDPRGTQADGSCE